MEEIDVKVIIRKLLKKWSWVAIALLFSISIAIYYLATTQKEYLVESTIQVKDELIDRGSNKEKFLHGFELVDNSSELEDEIGILTSYNITRKTLEKLDFEVSYFQYPNKFGPLGKLLTKEIYPPSFKVKIDTTGWQLLGTPIHIEFLDSETYRVSLSDDELPNYIYKFSNQKTKIFDYEVELDTVVRIGQTLETPYLKISMDEIPHEVLDGKRSYFIKISSLEGLAEAFQNKLNNSMLAEKSNIVVLSIEGTVPQKNIDFLNTLGQTYIENDLAKKRRLGEKTVEFIDHQLEGLTDSLRLVENMLKTFRSKHHIIDVEITSRHLTEKLDNLEKEKADLMVQNEYLHHILNYLITHNEVTDVVAPSSVGILDPHLSSLLLELSELTREKVTKDYSSNSDNPLLHVVNKKIANTKAALKDNVSNLIGSNKIALRENQKRIDKIMGVIERLPENELELKNIQRRLTLNDNIYTYLLKKRADAGVATAANLVDKTIIDAPRQIGQGPVSPNTMFVMLIALVAGVGLPIGLVIVKEFFHTKLDSKDQAVSWTTLPVLKSIGMVREKEKKQIWAGKGYLAHAFRYLRLHMNHLHQNKPIKAIGITSPASKEGKTFCALNLAVSFANSGRKTLLVDCDLHQPDLHKILKSNIDTGLSEFLSDGIDPKIMPTELPNLFFAAAGNPPENPSDLLTNPKLHEWITAIKKQYEIVIFDTPALGKYVDYLQLNPDMDFTFCVVREEVTEREEFKTVDKLLKQYDIETGIIYNGEMINLKKIT
jgi:capsular exopolysaccharide synthesis family protein